MRETVYAMRLGGDSTLCWACEADSIDDGGTFAVCSIYREVREVQS